MMKTSVNERIAQVVQNSGFKSLNAFAKSICVPQSTLDSCSKGVKEPRASLLTAILSGLPALSAEWLMRGKGEMWIKDGAAGSQAAGCGSILIGHGSAVGGSVTTNVGCDGARRGEPESGIVEELKKNVVTLKAENTLLREQLYKTQEMLMDALGKVR